MDIQQIPPDAKGVLFVVSTSHMDWHWHSTFEQYYNIGNPDGGNEPVRSILDEALSAIAAGTGYQYNLAEMAWLIRYITDNPGAVGTLQNVSDQFVLMGGGITSPDNLVCNGETFIRNFLVGRNFISRMGLDPLLTHVCWIPDDFGSDPQLPVVLSAMGMVAAGFARLPGWQQGSGGTMNGDYKPKSGESLSYELAKNGVTFYWKAADGSQVLGNYMLDSHQNPGYGVIWNQQYLGNNNGADTLNTFVTQNDFPTDPPNTSPTIPVVQPGNVLMAPAGGDFSYPNQDLVDGINYYNDNYYPSNGVWAQLGSFEDFANYITDQANNGKLSLQTLQGWDAMNKGFDPSNYWTGHFANLMELKVTQQRTANRLMAAETLSTLLRCQSYISGASLDALNGEIWSAWETLVPSSHHDFITGTSPEWVYYQEQLPMLEQALHMAEQALDRGMALLSQSVISSRADANDKGYVLFNPAGTDRSTYSVIEIPMSEAPEGVQGFYLEGNSADIYPVQLSAEKNVLVAVPGMPSTGYTVLYLTPNPSNTSLPVGTAVTVPASDAELTMSNGVIQVSISPDLSAGNALSSIIDVTSGKQVNSGLCNQIQVYSEGTFGNPYQMGNELDANGFVPAEAPGYSVDSAKIVENGPYRWRFEGKVHNASSSETTYAWVTYTLHYSEPMVRMRLKGQAPTHSANSIVTCWNVAGTPTSPPAMNYGTANHWNGPDFTPYWTGPTFRSTHDFVTLTDPANPTGPPLAAMYHEGIRAWAFDQGQLMGILIRNTNNNGGRGAQNADTDSHCLHYAFRLPGVNDPTSCEPLQESICYQQPVVTAPIVDTLGAYNAYNNSMTAPGQLASVSGPAVIRVARTQAGSGNPSMAYDAVPFSFVLRIYQPTNSAQGNWTVNIPTISEVVKQYGDSVIGYSLVTALEEHLDDITTPQDPSSLNFTTMESLTTLRVQTARLQDVKATTLG